MMSFDVAATLVVYGPLGILSAVCLWWLHADRKDTRTELKNERAARISEGRTMTLMLERATRALEQTAKSNDRLAGAIERMAPPSKAIAKLRKAA
jgi:hypothetical protein